MCGEKDITALNANNWQGSPPHVRGKEVLGLVVGAVLGVTPAYAGKSCDVHSNTNSAKDHPRTCGEKGLSTFWSRNHSGSPPHMRGKELLIARHFDDARITPACAGKSRSGTPYH